MSRYPLPGRLALLSLPIAFPIALLAAGCGDNLPAVSVEITSPERGTLTDGGTVEVSGIARGPRTISRVTVNGQDADIESDGRFTAMVDLEPGTNLLETIAYGLGGEQGVDRRGVSSGELVGGAVDDAVLLHHGVRGLAKVAVDLRSNVDMNVVYSTIEAGPLKESGDGCTLDSVTSTTTFAPAQALFMYSIAAGLGGEILFSPMSVAATANYMDSGCVAATGTFDFSTLELHWTYTIDIALGEDGAVDISLLASETLYDHEFLYTNADIDPLVFDRVATDLHDFLATALTTETTKLIEETTADWFGEFNRERNLAVDSIAADGQGVEARQRLTEVVASGATGLLITVGTEVEASELTTHVRTPAVAAVPRGSDAAVAISDDAINQSLGAMWRASDGGLPLPSGARLEFLVPPNVRAVAGSPPEILVVDLVASAGDVEITLSGNVPLVAGDDPEDMLLTTGAPSLVAQGGRGESSKDLQQEAIAALESLLREALRATALPTSKYGADDLLATSQDGFVEISVDLTE